MTDVETYEAATLQKVQAAVQQDFPRLKNDEDTFPWPRNNPSDHLPMKMTLPGCDIEFVSWNVLNRHYARKHMIQSDGWRQKQRLWAHPICSASDEAQDVREETILSYLERNHSEFYCLQEVSGGFLDKLMKRLALNETYPYRVLYTRISRGDGFGLLHVKNCNVVVFRSMSNDGRHSIRFLSQRIFLPEVYGDKNPSEILRGETMAYTFRMTSHTSGMSKDFDLLNMHLGWEDMPLFVKQLAVETRKTDLFICGDFNMGVQPPCPNKLSAHLKGTGLMFHVVEHKDNKAYSHVTHFEYADNDCHKQPDRYDHFAILPLK